MERIHAALTTGISITSTGTSVNQWIPTDSSGKCPMYVRLASNAAGFAALSGENTNATDNSILIQPKDAVILSTNGCRWIGWKSLAGTAVLTVTPLEYGGQEYSTLPYGAVLDLDFANQIYQAWG